ncbi:MAG: SH3 domain-containing protein [Acidimicrobiales bacterium]
MRQRRRNPRTVLVLAAGLLLAAACSDNEEGTADGSAVSDTGTPATEVTAPATTDGGGSPTSGGATTGSGASTTSAPAALDGETWRVVLVADDDTLAVRQQADPASTKIGELAWDAEGVTTTGQTGSHNGQPWYEVTTGSTAGWVNAAYLTPQVTAAEFAADPEPEALVDELAGVLQARGDLRPLVSAHGLYVDDRPRLLRFTTDELAGILTDTTVRSWIGPACGSPCLSATFAEHIAVPFLSAYDDTDTTVTVDDLASGPSSRIPESIVRPELAGFHHVTVFDPGDDPAADGLDWSTWYVYLDREPDGWKIVALSNDVWAP